MNFGKWIVVAFVLFAAFIGTLVTVCVKQDISLVSKNYYKEELIYQDQIIRINNTKSLAKKPTIAKVGNALQVTFGTTTEIQKGELKLFCPSNPEMDKEFAIVPGDGSSLLFDINSSKPAMYKAKLLWTMAGKEYFIEEVIYL